jgi:hypothetical protein
MRISNNTVTFDFDNKLITRRVANTHARPGHQPIYVEKDRTDTDIYICSVNYYKSNNLKNITGVECPYNQKLIINDFVIRKDVFNSYVKNVRFAFDEYGLNEFYKDQINDIFTIFNDLKTSLILIHTTQTKVRIGIENENIKKIVFDSLIGDLTQLTFDFSSKEILLSVPRENLQYLLKEVGKAHSKIKVDSVDKDRLLDEAKALQNYHEELLEKYGDDGNVIHEMLKTRSSSLQSYFRKSLLEKYSKCLLCDIKNPKLLIASHIKPASVSNTLEKADVNNGLLLCPLHDKLFDQGYISFDSSRGRLILANGILEKKKLYRLDDTKKYNHVTQKEVVNYMRYHNCNIFKDDIL